MIRYGVCVGSGEKFRQFALPGLELVKGLDRTMECRGRKSIFPAYNELLDAVKEDSDLEALVLLHEDLEIRDDCFEKAVRSALREPGVAIVGVIGGRGVSGIRWSKSAERRGYIGDAHHGINDYGRGAHDVDIVDGCLLVLSPWAVRNLRFDEETYSGFHGYDADICMQAREQGKRVRTADINVFHHTKGGFGDVRNHARADAAFRRKWGLPRPPWHHKLRAYSPVLHQILVKIGDTLRR